MNIQEFYIARAGVLDRLADYCARQHLPAESDILHATAADCRREAARLAADDVLVPEAMA